MKANMHLILRAAFVCFNYAVAVSANDQPQQSQSSAANAAVSLRIIHITDVYTLENFAALQTLIRASTVEGTRTVSMLTGDFLMPYLLSTVDGGKGMMTMINAVGIDYLTWGNHEKDLPLEQLMLREREYKGIWINSNMPSHPTVSNSTCQKEYEILELRNANHTRKVALLGILTDAPSLYPPDGKFHGAPIQDPFERMHYYNATLAEQVDMILPICHFYEAQDERTARELDFPLVIGGHDHHIVERRLHNSSTLLLKPGSDAHYANIIDLTWPSTNATEMRPSIHYEFVPLSNYEPDPSILAIEKEAYSVLDPLKETQLDFLPESFHPLSSQSARSGYSSMAAYLGSVICNATTQISNKPCDAFIVKGGNIRGGKLYPSDQQMTLEVLQGELADVDVYVAEVPGSILRGALRETWTRPGTGWFQYDTNVQVDGDGYITHIGGRLLDLDATYHIATLLDFFRARDGPTIGNYFKKHPNKIPHVGYPMHDLLMRYFAETAYTKLFHECDRNGDGNLDTAELRLLDTNNDAYLDVDEIKLAIEEILGLQTHDDEHRFAEYILQVAMNASNTVSDNTIRRASLLDLKPSRRDQQHKLEASCGRQPNVETAVHTTTA